MNNQLNKIRQLLLPLINAILLNKIKLKIIIPVALSATVVAILLLLPFFSNNNQLKSKITEYVKNTTGASIEIRGDSSLRILPMPAISLDDVLIRNYQNDDKTYNSYIEKLTIHLPFFYFITNYKINNITVQGATIESYQSSLSIKNTEIDKLTNELISNGNKQSAFFGFLNKSIGVIDNLSTITIADSRFIQYAKSGIQKDLTNIDLKLSISNKKITANGNLVAFNSLYNFRTKLIFNNKNQSHFTINSDAFNLNIAGILGDKNNKNILLTKFSATANGDIINFKNFYQLFFGSGDILSPDLKSDSKPIKFNAQLTGDGEEIAIKNIKFDSPIVTGAGEIDIGINDKISFLDIKLNFSDLDLNSLLIPKEQSENAVINQSANPLPESDEDDQIILLDDNKVYNKESLLNNYIKKSSKFDISTEIKINNIKIGDSVIKDFQFYSLASDANAIISPIKFNFDGNNFYVAGIVDNSSGYYPKFIGNIIANGDSIDKAMRYLDIKINNIAVNQVTPYKFSADVIFAPNSKLLNHLHLVLDNGRSEAYGSIKITENNGKNIRANINFSKLDLSKQISLPKENDYFAFGNLFDKLLWLNNIDGNYNIKLKFDELVYKTEKFNNQTTELNFGRGFFKIQTNNNNSYDDIFNLDFAVDLINKVPTVSLKLTGESLAINAAPETDASSQNMSADFITNFYKLSSLQGLNGSIDIDLKKLKFYQDNLQNIDIKATIQDGEFIFTKFNSDIHGGKFVFNGNANIKFNKIISGSFSCKSCSIDSVGKNYFGANNLSGLANIEGSIVSVAKDKKEALSNTALQISFNINSPTIKGYGLTSLIDNLVAKNALADPENIMHNKEAITKYSQASGTISIKDGQNGSYSCKLQSAGINSVFTGKIKVQHNFIEGAINSIFLLANNQKPIPINVVTNIIGRIDDVAFVSNLNQVRQYLGLEKISTQLLSDNFAKQFEQKQQQYQRMSIINGNNMSTIIDNKPRQDNIMQYSQ